MTRPSTSVGLLAANGITMVTGRVGQAWAEAPVAESTVTDKASMARRSSCRFMSQPL